MGRSFMYGVAALGSAGGNHTIAMIKKQLNQIMEQLSCSKIGELHKTRVK
jgi:L-lactate dehydrogenase (cytochrome)